MKITGISGSPNAGGNNEKILEMALGIARERGHETEKLLMFIHSWMHIHGMIVVGDSAHFGGIALKPVDSDEHGSKTVKDTMNMICETLARFK